MTDKKDTIELPKSIIATLALEIWRLWHIVEKSESQANTLSLRYSVKKMKNSLMNQGCIFIDLTREVYDAGMAVDILDTEGEKSEEGKNLIIKEMIAPIILFNDEILMHGQAILEWR